MQTAKSSEIEQNGSGKRVNVPQGRFMKIIRKSIELALEPLSEIAPCVFTVTKRDVHRFGFHPLVSYVAEMPEMEDLLRVK